MTSPYFLNNGGGVNFGPAPGLAGIFAQREHDAAAASSQGMQMLANMIGYFAQSAAANTQNANAATANRAGSALNAAQPGATGAAAPAADPTAAPATTDGTAPAPAAVLPVGNPNDQTGAPAVDPLKQLTRQGKLADAQRAVLSAQTPSTADVPAKVWGYTDDEWKHLGTKDKIAAGAAHEAALQQRTAALATQETLARMQDFQAQADQRRQQALAMDAEANTAAKYASFLDDKVNHPDPNDAEAVAYAKSIPQAVKYQIAAGAQMGKMNPKAAAPFIKNLQSYFANPDQFSFDPAKDVTDIGGGMKVVKTSRGGGQVVQTPESIAAAEQAKYSVKYPPGSKVGVENGVIVARDKTGNIIGIHGAANPMTSLMGGGTGMPEVPGGGASQPGNGLPAVTTQAQYNALPSGAQYLGKDGVTVYRKP